MRPRPPLALLALGFFAGTACSSPPDTAPEPSAPASSATAAGACVAAPKLAPPSLVSQRDSLDAALAALSLDRASFALTPTARRSNGLFDASDPRRLADLDLYGTSPLAMADFAAALSSALDATDVRASSALVLAMSRRGGSANGVCLDPATLALDPADTKPLEHALVAIGAPPADASAVPLDLQRALVPIVRAMADASAAVAAARAKVSPALLLELNATASWLLQSYHLALRPELVSALEAVDVDAMTSAAARVALAVEGADLARFKGISTTGFQTSTPFGALVISGPSNDTFLPGTLAEHAWLMVDTGGDDTYRVPAGGAYFDRAVSVAIDLGGNDVYSYVPASADGDGVGERLPSDGAGRVKGQTRSHVTRQGGAVLGIGMLFDIGGGNDRYESLALSQGAAVHGVGVLSDDGGNDTYTAEIFSQAGAAWGVGLLLDAGGDDRYVAYRQAQGFGAPRGVGMLDDAAGNDTYLADPGDRSSGGDLLYPSAQLPAGEGTTGNESFVQGCGAGHRPDEPDPGFPFPGGLGVLRDRAGDDAYEAGVFAQGCGFAMGVGGLLDGGGDDHYDALYYAQGAGVHMAAGVLVDVAGDDGYGTRLREVAATMGLGYDVSVGALVDLAGDDRVRAPALSGGGGGDNGIGLMIASEGTDALDASAGAAWGRAWASSGLAAWRASEKTVGVFVRAAGKSTWDGAGKLAEGSTRASTEHGVLLSVGVDLPSGRVVLE